MSSALNYIYVVKTTYNDKKVYVCNKINDKLLLSTYQEDAQLYTTFKEAITAAKALNKNHPNYNFYADFIITDECISLCI